MTDNIKNNNTEQNESDSLKEAQQRLVHAMLVSCYQDTPESISQRVDKVYLRIKTGPGLIHHTWFKIASSMAACLLVFLGLGLFYSNPDNVYADFDNIKERFSACDQTYEINIQKIQNIEPKENPKLSKQDIRNIRTVREINGATLYVRGNQYVLERTLSDGTTVYNGFDSYKRWRSDKAGLRTFSRPGSIHRVVPEAVTDLLFVDIGEMLNVMCQKYKVTRGRDKVGNMSGLHYVALKKGPISGSRLPQRIDLWVDPDTGQIKKMFCNNVSFGTKKYRLIISLINTDPLPMDWFSQRLPEENKEPDDRK